MTTIEREIGDLNARTESLEEYRTWSRPIIENLRESKSWALGAAVGLGFALGTVTTCVALWFQFQGV